MEASGLSDIVFSSSSQIECFYFFLKFSRAEFQSIRGQNVRRKCVLPYQSMYNSNMSYTHLFTSLSCSGQRAETPEVLGWSPLSLCLSRVSLWSKFLTSLSLCPHPQTKSIISTSRSDIQNIWWKTGLPPVDICTPQGAWCSAAACQPGLQFWSCCKGKIRPCMWMCFANCKGVM